MKKLALLLLAVLSLTVVSCKQSVPDKLVNLANQAEAKGSKWSQDKWEQVATEFGDLLDEYTENENSYGPIKKFKVLAASAKFYAVAVKYVVAPEAKAKLQELSENAGEADGDTEEDAAQTDLEKAISEGAGEILEGLKGLGL